MDFNSIIDLLADILLDSIKDLCLILPILYITYLAMEVIEHIAGEKTLGFLQKAKGWGPAAGALLGAVPECGISGGIAGLYSARIITAGTFIAAVLSTSDEMLPILLSNGKIAELVGFLLFKILFGIAAGFAVDLIVRFFGKSKWSDFAHDFGNVGTHGEICSICKREGCNCGHDHAHGTHEGKKECHHNLWLAALIHTAKIGGIIFAVSLVIGLLMTFFGEDTFSSLAKIPVLGEIISSLFGLVPNCSVSVTLTNLYTEGLIGPGPLMAGLLTNGGVGLLVLFRLNRGRENLKKNIMLCVTLVVLGVIGGLIAKLIF